MSMSTRLRGLLPALTLISMVFSARAQDSEWSDSLTPYLWLPNLNGTLKYTLPPSNGSDASVETGPNDYLGNLSAVLMLSAEARKGRWAIFGDVIYLKFESEESSVKTIDFSATGSNPFNTTLDI